MSNILEKLNLDFNPFEPAATGAPIQAELSIPEDQKARLEDILASLQTGTGVKALLVVGEYGTGKTCLLQWLHNEVLPSHLIKSFYFDNPGVQFYDLANMLLRTIGRKDFAKFIWELAGAYVTIPYQKALFQDGFEEYLSSVFRPHGRQDITTPLQEAIIKTEVTIDEEIAHCLARIVTETIKKPYFEYRNFIPRQSGSMVPEGEEAPYFRAILKTIAKGTGARAIAFLIDEFEEIGLQKRLTKRAAHDYLATMKRLLNLAQSEDIDFWIVLSMTPDAYDRTRELEPALIERISGQEHLIEIEALNREEAAILMRSRIHAARSEDSNVPHGNLFPFPEKIFFTPVTYSNPRRLVKTCFSAISGANAQTQLPFTEDYLREVEKKLYPVSIASRE